MSLGNHGDGAPRRRLRFAAGVTAGLLMLGACSPSPASPSPSGAAVEPSTAATAVATASAAPAEPVTLTILAFVPQKYYQPLIDAFTAKYPNIKLNFEAVTLETSVSAVVQRYAAGDSTYDIVLADQSWTGSLAGPGALLDLTDTDYGKAAAAAFAPSVLEGSTFKGRLMAAPYWGSWSVVMYNKTLLKAAGVDFPSADPAAPWTYQQLAIAAAKAKAAGAKWGVAWSQPGNYYARQPLIESAGGGSGLTGPDLLTPAVNNDGWINALTYYGKLYKDGLAPRGQQCCGQADPLFNDGQLMFYIVEAQNMKVAQGIDFGLAPMPQWEGGNGKGYSPSGSGAWGINPNSKHIAEALEFLTFHTLTVEGAMAGSEVAGLPALPAGAASRLGVLVASDPRYEGIDKLQAAMAAVSVARPPSTKYSAFEVAVNAAILDIENGSDVKSTLDKLQANLEGILSR